MLTKNFRPSIMEKWGFSYETLSAVNPKPIILHMLGYDQMRPKRGKSGSMATAEAMTGLRYLTGEPG